MIPNNIMNIIFEPKSKMRTYLENAIKNKISCHPEKLSNKSRK
jgi:hypothetical protein